jgi:hypothetical protein
MKYIKIVLILFTLLNIDVIAGPNDSDEINWHTILKNYREKIVNSMYELNGHFTNHRYIEAYAMRAQVVNYDWETNSLKDYSCFINWADGVILDQGKVLNPAAFDIGYGATNYSKPKRWYIADASAIALALLSITRNRHVEGEIRDKYIKSVCRYADYVMESWQNANGSVALGYENNNISPIKEYWCATSLFSAVLWNLYDATLDTKYKSAAVKACSWLLQYEYEKEGEIDGTTFKDALPAYAFYIGEGLIVYAQHVSEESVEYSMVTKKIKELVNWLLKTQRNDGGWDCKSQWWIQKVPVLYSILNWYYLSVDHDPSIKMAADNILKYCVSTLGIHELQLETHTQSMSFMFLAVTDKCFPRLVFPSK